MYQILQTTRTLSCQTGYQLPELRFNGTEAVVNRSWVKEPGLVHQFSSTALFWENIEDSCRAVKMIPEEASPDDWSGSTTLLWPLFVSLSFSQFMETISSALRGRQPMPETGMTMFEHSLAFAEAEMVVRTSAGIGLFGLPTSPASNPNASGSEGSNPGAFASPPTMTFTRSMLLKRLNVPPEVLFISLISGCSHLSSHVLGVIGLQDRLRLANTGLWGMMFLGLFFNSFAKFSQPANLNDIHVIRYPTVCIIGFIPHILVLMGMVICMLVYTMAIVSTLLSSPPKWRQLSTWERVKLAHANMSASASLSNIRIKYSEDFYTFLLKVGYKIVSAATEAVYFNEGVSVTLTPGTWLERTRLHEATTSARSPATQVPLELQEGFAGGEGFGLVDEVSQNDADGRPLPSGFARERKTMQKMNKSTVSATREEGVGISQRSGRWMMSWRLIEQTFSLVNYVQARFLISILERFGRQSPVWLAQMGRVHSDTKSSKVDMPDSKFDSQMFSDVGWLLVPKKASVDVEGEARKRLQLTNETQNSALDENLYSWWKRGGWWGDVDSSGDYRPSTHLNDENDDITSVTSESTAWDTDDSSELGSGARTPTQEFPTSPPKRRRITSSISPAPSSPHHDDDIDTDTDTDLSNHLTSLAALLDPKTLAQKQEARMLSLRLRQSSTPAPPMTRSAYRRTLLRDSATLLHPTSSAAIAARRSAALLSPEDEEMLLEQLILDRRRNTNPGAASQNSGTNNSSQSASGEDWSTGGAGMGSGGPQCAVCRSAPRTVLAWPCRCLSLCEECRVSLAVNGFGSCVCCRRDVVAFSRLFVP